jgi:arginyl-tRNA synthetase
MTELDPVLALSAFVRRIVVATLGAEYADVDPQVRLSDRADLQADLALGLAKRTKRKPRDIADELARAIAADTTNDLVEKVDVAGPGFLNVTLRVDWLQKSAAAAVTDARLCVPTAAVKDTVVIDYSHPNVAKEMHVGHLRSTVIGDALARLLEFRGHTVLRQNHIGDWGTPFGMLIEHLLDLGEAAAERDLALGELAAFYKAARAKFDADPAFADRARTRVVLLQSGDLDTLARWRTLVALSTRYFETVYAKLDVTLKPADIKGESFYNPLLQPLADELQKSGAATISDGALCLFPKGFTNKEGEPLPLIVQKTDKGFGYATTDLAAIRHRVKDLHATRILYVVGAPQTQHLAMIMAAAKELSWLGEGTRAEHVAFGSVLGTDKRMFKTRSGDTVRLVDLIDEAVERATQVVTEKASGLSEEERRSVGHMVGVGSIKYADLSSDRVKDYVFDIDRMVSFEGNTAGYLQYAHARIHSLFRKANISFQTHAAPIVIGEPEERALVLALLGFGRAVTAVEASLEPHKLAGYLYGLATTFTSFYEKCPVLKSEGATQASRLSLTKLTAQTLGTGLSLLGISVPERM